MNHWLLLIFILCFSVFFPGASFADQKPVLLTDDIIFQPGGGIRTRYFNRIESPSGAVKSVEGYLNGRFQLDFSLNKGEFFKIFSRLIHRNVWGRQENEIDSSFIFRDSFSGNNGLYVNEAWGWWQWSDTLSVKMGRAPLQIGSGKTYGANQWFDVPTTFDQFNILWQWEQVKLQIIGSKLSELAPVAGGNGDPEENHYIVNLDLGNFSDWIPLWNVHFAQIHRAEGALAGGSSQLPRIQAQLWSGEFQFDLNNFHGELFTVFINGELDEIAAGTSQLSQHSFDVRLSYVFPALSELRLKAGSHLDSGDSSAGAPNADDPHLKGFYYDIYGRSGRMDLIRWGNLLSLDFAIELEPRNNMTLGVEFHRFMKREVAGNTHWGLAGVDFRQGIRNGQLILSRNKDLGSEIDFWLEYTSSVGVKSSLTYSAFLPGESILGATNNTGRALSSTLHQFIIELSYFF